MWLATTPSERPFLVGGNMAGKLDWRSRRFPLGVYSTVSQDATVSCWGAMVE